MWLNLVRSVPCLPRPVERRACSVPCNPVMSQSSPAEYRVPCNPVIAQSHPLKYRAYRVPNNPGMAQSRGILSRPQKSGTEESPWGYVSIIIIVRTGTYQVRPGGTSADSLQKHAHTQLLGSTSSLFCLFYPPADG